MKKNLMFTTANSSQEIALIIKNNIDILVEKIFDEEAFPVAVTSLVNLEQQVENRLLEFVHFVDRYFNIPNEKSEKKFQKISTILAASIYYKNYYDKIKDLSNEELTILSKYSVVERLPRYEEFSTIFTKRLLDLVISKTGDFTKTDKIMLVIETELEKGITEEEILNELDNVSLEELIKREDKIIEEISERGSKQ